MDILLRSEKRSCESETANVNKRNKNEIIEKKEEVLVWNSNW